MQKASKKAQLLIAPNCTVNSTKNTLKIPIPKLTPTTPKHTPYVPPLSPDIPPQTPDVPPQTPDTPPQIPSTTKTWRKGTTLVCGDSILSGLREKRLHRNGMVKVRTFLGASIEDLRDHLVPLLRKKPQTIVMHIGTNNCSDESSEIVMGKLSSLVDFVKNTVDGCKVLISTPTHRFDDAKATVTCQNLTKKIIESGFNVINNSNINSSHLNSGALHLNPSGSSRLAQNILKKLKSL